MTTNVAEPAASHVDVFVRTPRHDKAATVNVPTQPFIVPCPQNLFDARLESAQHPLFALGEEALLLGASLCGAQKCPYENCRPPMKKNNRKPIRRWQPAIAPACD